MKQELFKFPPKSKTSGNIDPLIRTMRAVCLGFQVNIIHASFLRHLEMGFFT